MYFDSPFNFKETVLEKEYLEGQFGHAETNKPCLKIHTTLAAGKKWFIFSQNNTY